MNSTIASFVSVILILGISTTKASKYGLLRVGARRTSTPITVPSTSTNGALANEDFQILFRKLFSYENPGNGSMMQLSMEQLSMAQQGPTVQLSMARLSMAWLSMAPMSMVGFSMVNTSPLNPEMDNTVTAQGHGTNNNNNDSIRDPNDGNKTIQSNNGTRVWVSTGLMVAGFLMLVLAAASVYKMKRYAALSQNDDDALSMPTTV